MRAPAARTLPSPATSTPASGQSIDSLRTDAGVTILPMHGLDRRTPMWVTISLIVLMATAGTVYALGIPLGLIHNYYGPAVYSMAHSWSAFFWGAFDPAVSITLDKLPLAFQVQALSVRVFGWSDWAVLMPQVLEATATIGVVFLTVRRWIGAPAGLLAAAAFATTPIVAALAHSQIVDTLLVLLLTCSAYAWTRAVQGGRLGWLLLTGVFVGLAFNTKMVQAWGVLPALALVHWACAPGSLLRRTLHVLAAGVVTLAVSLWWLVVASLVPAGSRPWIDGSAANSAWEMVFVYNLASRYGESASGGAPGGGGGLDYLFGSGVATQVGWLYPLALAGLVGVLWWRRREPRTDAVRAGALMWGLWALTFGLAFSFGRVAHSFYVVALAPAVVSLAAAGAVLGWQAWRAGRRSGWLLPASLVATVAWTGWLHTRHPDFQPWVTPLVVGLGASGLVALWFVRPGASRARVAAPLAVGALTAGLLVTPAAWAASTTQPSTSGSSIGPSAGPVGGMGGSRGPGSGSDLAQPPGRDAAGQAPTGQPPTGQAPGAGRTPPSGMPTALPAGQAPTGAMPTPPGGAAAAGMGSPGGDASSGAELLAWLRAHEPGSTYDAVVLGYGAAGSLIEAGGSVLAVGGFTGAMPNLTTAELQALVDTGQVRHVLIGEGQGGASASDLQAWVVGSCTAVDDAPSTDLYRCG